MPNLTTTAPPSWLPTCRSSALRQMASATRPLSPLPSGSSRTMSTACAICSAGRQGGESAAAARAAGLSRPWRLCAQLWGLRWAHQRCCRWSSGCYEARRMLAASKRIQQQLVARTRPLASSSGGKARAHMPCTAWLSASMNCSSLASRASTFTMARRPSAEARVGRRL